MESNLKLRGHHIGLLGVLLFTDPYEKSYSNKFDPLKNYDCYFNKKINKYLNYERAFSKENNTNDLPPSKIMRKPIHIEQFMLQLIIEKPDLRVQVVEGLDSICHLCRKGPPYPYDSCVRDVEEDSFCLEQYRLDIGETYTAAEILKRLIDFKQKTGLNSPRLLFQLESRRMGTKELINQPL